MICMVMPPQVGCHARGRPASRAKGRARGRGVGSCEVKDSSSSSTPGNVFCGVPGGAQYFREMVKAMQEFTQAA